MSDSPQAEPDPQNTQADNEKSARRYLRRIATYAVIAYLILLGISFLWPNLTERTKFFTANGLTLALLIVAIAQILIYYRQQVIMQHQLKAMDVQAKTSEMSAKTAERSVQVAEDAFYIGQRAYVGIKRMAVSNLVAGQYPTLTITWINGGHTPAWRFRSIPRLVLGEKPPPKRGFSWLEDDFSDISVSFIPAGEEKTVEYRITDFRITEEVVAAINSSTVVRLYALAEGGYLDIKGKPRHFRVWALYDLFNEGFVELEDEQNEYYPNPN